MHARTLKGNLLVYIHLFMNTILLSQHPLRNKLKIKAFFWSVNCVKEYTKEIQFTKPRCHNTITIFIVKTWCTLSKFPRSHKEKCWPYFVGWCAIRKNVFKRLSALQLETNKKFQFMALIQYLTPNRTSWVESL